MDAVSAAASIISIIQLAGQVTVLGYGYIGSVARASEDVEKLMAEVVSLGGVLVGLKDYTNSIKGADPDSESEVLETFDAPLRACRVELEKLESKLKTISGTRERMQKRLGKRLGGFFGSLKWPFKESETLQIMTRIGRHKDTLSLAIDIAHIHEFREERAVQSAVRTDEKRKAILNWLYPGNMHTKHAEISGRRQKDTGQWLLKSTEYQSWVDGQAHRLLWGYGIPGGGKTFLSSVSIDDLNRLRVENTGVAYIYFDYIERDRQRPEHILSSLIKQLVSQLSTLPTGLENLYEQLKSSERPPTTSELYRVLTSIFNSFGRVFFVFDALDECDQKAQRNKLLPLFHQMGKDGANLFLTSRQYPEDIQKSFQDVAKIELSAQDGDIRRYVHEKIRESSRAQRLVEQVKCEERIVSELIDCAKGMFLLVKFHIEYLCQQTTPKQLVSALETLKTSSATGAKYPLDPTYDRVVKALRQQPDSCVDLAMKVFAWLTRARRTLTIQELEIAISVEPGCFELDKLDLPDRATILDVCGGLVTIDDNSKTIRLAHMTVQEYLLRKSIIPKQMDITFATTCITYLSLDAFAGGACESSASLDSRLESHPFLEYATQYLPSHLKFCDEDSSEGVILDFLERPGNLCSWAQVDLYLVKGKDVSDKHHKTFMVKQIPLQMASAIGNPLVVRKLLEEGADISETKELTGSCALMRAAARGHEEVIRVLIEMGANISAQDKCGWAALHFAANKGHLEVVRLLLEKGADISAQDKDEWTALHFAANKGHLEVVRLLLEKGADISAQDKDEWTALHFAASRGHLEVVRLLLEKGADISAQDKDEWTALHFAASRGHLEVVRLLLEKGADISAQDKDGFAALHKAAGWGHLEVVRLLLEKGADISAQTKIKSTALHLAARNGHVAIEQLLEKGTVNRPGETVA